MKKIKISKKTKTEAKREKRKKKQKKNAAEKTKTPKKKTKIDKKTKNVLFLSPKTHNSPKIRARARDRRVGAQKKNRSPPREARDSYFPRVRTHVIKGDFLHREQHRTTPLDRGNWGYRKGREEWCFFVKNLNKTRFSSRISEKVKKIKKLLKLSFCTPTVFIVLARARARARIFGQSRCF